MVYKGVNVGTVQDSVNHLPDEVSYYDFGNAPQTVLEVENVLVVHDFLRHSL